MHIHRTYIALCLAGSLLLAGFVSAATLASSDPHWYTPMGFVELLIERNIITANYAERARSYARLFSKSAPSADVSTPGMRDADKVRVTTSQLIRYSNLEFAVGEEIQGLLLLVENSSSTDAILEAKRKCQVTYRIFSDTETLVYDSATEERCKTDERVTYLLGAGQTRMFEIKHATSTLALPAGEYTFTLEYPGYGGGDKKVTVVNR